VNPPSDPNPNAARTVAILGLFGSPNLGNEATFGAFVHNIRQRLPGLRFVCVAARQSSVESEHGIPRLELDPLPVARHFWRLRPAGLRHAAADLGQRLTEGSRARRAEALLDGVCALTMPGTGVIDDFGQSPLDMPAHLDRWTAAAQRRGIDISFLSIGVSRVQSAASRTRFARSLARADYCSYRDAASVRNAGALGATSGAGIYPDLAFSLPTSPAAPPAYGHNTPLRIGIGVMGYYGWNRPDDEGRRIYATYLDKLCELVGGALDDGHEVRLLTGDTRADDATVADVAARCGRRRGAAQRLYAPSIRSYHDVLAEISATDLVVATRFHNVLLALKLARPTISIGYSDKNDALLADFGLADYAHAIERFDVAAVLEQMRRLARQPDPAYRDLPAHLEHLRARLAQQYDDVCARWRDG
jgi:polysaccharide pyruvyl transferase WcaK-like protein